MARCILRVRVPDNCRRLLISITKTAAACTSHRLDGTMGDMHSKQFIAGAWRPGSMDKVLVDRNPYDGSTVAEFNIARVSDIDEAYRAAECAKLEWDRVNPVAKRAVFERALRYV